MSVRAKVQLQEKRVYANYNTGTAVGAGPETFVFRAVSDNNIEENKRFSKYTPSGEFTMYVDNPLAQEQFKLGAFYYVDFSEAV